MPNFIEELISPLPDYIRKEKWQDTENRINLVLKLLSQTTSLYPNTERLLLSVLGLITYYINHNKNELASDLAYNFMGTWSLDNPVLLKKIEFIYQVGLVYQKKKLYLYALRFYWLSLKYLTSQIEADNDTLFDLITSIKQGIDGIESAILENAALNYKNLIGGNIPSINSSGTLQDYLNLLDETIPFIDQLSSQYGFHTIARDIYQNFLLFATDAASELLSPASLTTAYYRQHIFKQITYLDQCISEPPVLPFATQENWRAHVQSLTALRQELKENVHTRIATAQTVFNQGITHFIATLIKNCCIFAGKAPCEYVLVNIGSLARQNFSPFSDIDIAIFVKEKKFRDHSFFKTLIKLLAEQLNLLGEIEEITAGLYIDSKDFVLLVENNFLVNTPEAYLTDRVENIPIPNDLSDELTYADKYYALHRCNILYASEAGEALLALYQKSLAEQLQLPGSSLIQPCQTTQDAPYTYLAKKYLAAHQQDYQNNNISWSDNLLNQAIDLKNTFITPFFLWCTDVALYFGLHQCDEKTQQPSLALSIPMMLELFKSRLHPACIVRLTYAYQQLQQLRIENQFANHEKRHLKKTPIDSWLIANNKETDLLKEIHTTILDPIYAGLAIFTTHDLTASELIDPLLAGLEILLIQRSNSPSFLNHLTHLFQYLLERNDSFTVYSNYYKKLSALNPSAAFHEYFFSQLQLAEENKQLTTAQVQAIKKTISHPQTNGSVSFDPDLSSIQSNIQITPNQHELTRSNSQITKAELKQWLKNSPYLEKLTLIDGQKLSWKIVDIINRYAPNLRQLQLKNISFICSSVFAITKHLSPSGLFPYPLSGLPNLYTLKLNNCRNINQIKIDHSPSLSMIEIANCRGIQEIALLHSSKTIKVNSQQALHCFKISAFLSQSPTIQQEEKEVYQDNQEAYPAKINPDQEQQSLFRRTYL
ncbi:MAG TPA: hypothetical protein VHZ76_09335 [Gammaproteobacteria bacterium]|nr:hypothetical protein [Gammaproteobacteria bacterium]